MPRNLKKFANRKFVRTIDLGILRRLLERHADALDLDLAALEADTDAVRDRLLQFFTGPEDAYPEGLIADLHRIDALGTQNGLRIILEQAAREAIVIVPPSDLQNQVIQDPKHVAVRVFLDYPRVFDRASDWLALTARSSLAEFVGAEEGIEPDITDDTKRRFEDAARTLFLADLRGGHCRVGWYEDDGEVNLVVTHGSEVNTTEVVDDNDSGVISYRAAEHAVLSYSPATAVLKVGGVPKARRAEIAEAFARTMLDRPGFFAAEDAQHLYTLEPVERAGFGFTPRSAFDPSVQRIQIVEAQIDRTSRDARTGEVQIAHSFVARDSREGDALARLGELLGHQRMGGEWRLNYLSLRVHLQTPEGRPARVTVKVKPPSSAQFKRERFEEQIMTLLRRNGLVRDRTARDLAVAAE